MLTHKIITHKERKTIFEYMGFPHKQQQHPAILPSTPSPAKMAMHLNTVDHNSLTRKVPASLGWNPSLKEYDEYVLKSGLKRGDYVISAYSEAAASKYALHVVINIVPSPARIKRWINGHPKAWTLLQVFGADGQDNNPWIHDENCHEYRHATKYEIDTFIQPEIDYVRNRIQKFQFTEQE